MHEQFGFRNNSSTGITSHKLINDLLLSLNNKLRVGGIFCDLQKAFDCIKYDILSEMEFYGISSKGNKLIKFYLNREFCYKNNSMKYFLNVSQLNTAFHKAWYLDHYFFPFTLMIFQK
jgi:hypothetical protein